MADRYMSAGARSVGRDRCTLEITSLEVGWEMVGANLRKNVGVEFTSLKFYSHKSTDCKTIINTCYWCRWQTHGQVSGCQSTHQPPCLPFYCRHAVVFSNTNNLYSKNFRPRPLTCPSPLYEVEPVCLLMFDWRHKLRGRPECRSIKSKRRGDGCLPASLPKKCITRCHKFEFL